MPFSWGGAATPPSLPPLPPLPPLKPAALLPPAACCCCSSCCRCCLRCRSSAISAALAWEGRGHHHATCVRGVRADGWCHACCAGLGPRGEAAAAAGGSGSGCAHPGACRQAASHPACMATHPPAAQLQAAPHVARAVCDLAGNEFKGVGLEGGYALCGWEGGGEGRGGGAVGMWA